MTFTTQARLDAFIDGAIYGLLDIDTGTWEDEDADDFVERVYAHQWIHPAAHWERDALTPNALERMRRECEDFFRANIRDLVRYVVMAARDTAGGWHDAGTDFHLTRNHHGVGFWDRGAGAVGDRLTDASHPYGEIHGWITDDDRVDVE